MLKNELVFHFEEKNNKINKYPTSDNNRRICCNSNNISALKAI